MFYFLIFFINLFLITTLIFIFSWKSIPTKYIVRLTNKKLIMLVKASLSKEGCKKDDMNIGIGKATKHTFIIGFITLTIYAEIFKCANFCEYISLTIIIIAEMIVCISNIDSGLEPNKYAKYSSGRFKRYIELITIWYCFNFPVACIETHKGPCNDSTRLNIKP